MQQIPCKMTSPSSKLLQVITRYMIPGNQKEPNQSKSSDFSFLNSFSSPFYLCPHQKALLSVCYQYSCREGRWKILCILCRQGPMQGSLLWHLHVPRICMCALEPLWYCIGTPEFEQQTQGADHAAALNLRASSQIRSTWQLYGMMMFGVLNFLLCSIARSTRLAL